MLPYDSFRFSRPKDYAGWLLSPASGAGLVLLPPPLDPVPATGFHSTTLETFYYELNAPTRDLPVPPPLSAIGPLFGAASGDRELGLTFLTRTITLATAFADQRDPHAPSLLLPCWWTPGGSLERMCFLSLSLCTWIAQRVMEGEMAELADIPPVPAYDLSVWSGDPFHPPREDGRPRGPWGTLTALHRLSERWAVRGYDRALAMLVPSSPSTSRRTVSRIGIDGTRPQTGRRASNVDIISCAQALLVRCAAVSLRIVLHASFERMHSMLSSSTLSALSSIAEIDPSHMLSRVAAAFGQGGVDLDWSCELDYLYGIALRRRSSGLLATFWGISDGMDDSPRRAGAWIPDQAYDVDTKALARLLRSTR